MSKRKKYIIIIFAFVFSFMFGNEWASYNWVTVNYYEHDTGKIGEEIKIVVISDLHEHEFCENNKELIEKIEEQNPELILMVGDFVNNDSENVELTCALIRELKNIAPVYYALGNHELTYMENAEIDLEEELEAAGTTVLEKEYEDVEINGKVVRIGGMYDYAFSIKNDDIQAFLSDLENTDNLKIMLSHRPDSFIFGDASTEWDIDLVVSGHLHGGQVVLPIFGGIYGGDQGYFPEYVHGLYTKDKMQIFVTSGLGSNPKKVPRFNNRPEIAVITLY